VTRLARLASVVAAGAGIAALALACDDAVSHVFAGRLYEPARGCVDTVTSIDVVDGPAPGGPCAPACFVGPYATDAGDKPVYVSTMCAPFPPAFDTTGTAPACAVALAAYARNDTCLDDGGTTSPPAPADGGAASDAATD
jgi:hypothetical protein